MPRHLAPRRFSIQVREHPDLPDPVARRDHRQDRLVERAADDFDSPGRHMPGQPVEIFGMMGVEPFQQRPAGVQGDPQVRKLLEQIEKQAITVLIRLLEHAVEVADGLVIVQSEDEANRLRHADTLARRGQSGCGVFSDCSGRTAG